MKILIQVGGVQATYDGSWKCRDAGLLRRLAAATEDLPFAYRPNPIHETAAEVAEALGGSVLHADPQPESTAPADAEF